MPSENQKRLVAQKVSIKEILQGEYVKEDGWNPNYIITDGKKIYRINLISVVLSKSNQTDTNYYSLLLDDGTSKISARSFEKNYIIENLEIGDVVLLIGRAREYGKERYVIPEIIKKIENKGWIEVRKLELRKNEEKKKIEEKVERVSEEEVITEPSSQVIYNLIKKMDNGNGVDFDSVIKNSNLSNTEEIISNLLQEGEVFELRPGKLKVLE